MTERAMAGRCNRFHSRHRCGLTLVELIIVVLITGILAAVALPRWSNSLNQRRLTLAAGRIAADLQHAQSTAYASSSAKVITYDTIANQYTISGLSGLESQSAAYVVRLADDPYRCQLVSAFGQTGLKTLSINGFGELAAGGNIIVSCGPVTKTIVVDSVAGKVVVQ